MDRCFLVERDANPTRHHGVHSSPDYPTNRGRSHSSRVRVSKSVLLPLHIPTRLAYLYLPIYGSVSLSLYLSVCLSVLSLFICLSVFACLFGYACEANVRLAPRGAVWAFFFACIPGLVSTLRHDDT